MSSRDADYLIISIGSANVKLWRSRDGNFSCHSAATPELVSRQLYSSHALDHPEPVAEMLHTAIASTFVTQTTQIVLLTNADDSPHFWACVRDWIGRTVPDVVSRVHPMSHALFTAHLHAIPTGIVVDVGHRATRVTAICDGIVVITECATSTTVGMRVVSGEGGHEVIGGLVENYLALQCDSPHRVADYSSDRLEALSTGSAFMNVLTLLDGICEVIDNAVAAVKRLGVAACQSHFLLTGGGIDCAPLRECVCCHIYAVAPHAIVSWE